MGRALWAGGQSAILVFSVVSTFSAPQRDWLGLAMGASKVENPEADSLSCRVADEHAGLPLMKVKREHPLLEKRVFALC